MTITLSTIPVWSAKQIPSGFFEWGSITDLEYEDGTHSYGAVVYGAKGKQVIGVYDDIAHARKAVEDYYGVVVAS